MNFATLKQKVKAVAFPLGEAENLVDIHDTFIVETLIDLQQYVPCFRERNTNIVAFPDTRYNCGLTVVGAPDGIIKRIYTIGSDFCCKVNYRRSTLAQMRHLEAVKDLDVEAAVYPTQSPFQPELPLGDLYADSSSDSVLGRANTGYWAIEGCRLYLWPSIQSSEDVVIEWVGIKMEYVDSDILFDAGIASAVRSGLLQQIARNIERVDADDAKFTQAYADAKGDLYHWCRQKIEGSYAEEDNMPVITNGCIIVPNAATGTNVVTPAVDPSTVTTTFAIIGDYGTNTSGALSVASLVNGWSPQYIFTTGGNNRLGIASYNGYDQAVGSKFHQLLFPYTGQYGAGSVDYNRFWPCIGLGDRSSAALLMAYQAFFTLPTGNGELYYDHVEGPVHFFVLDSRNPAGVTVNSGQAEWLRITMAASISPFKVVIVNEPPFSSAGTTGMFAVGDTFDYASIRLSDTNGYSSGADYLLPAGERTDLPPALYAWSEGNVSVPQNIPNGHDFVGEIKWAGGDAPLVFVPGGTVKPDLQWPFKEWGASLVLNGAADVYERLVNNTLPYITNGLGGNILGTFNDSPAPGSLVRYADNFGAIRGTVSCTLLRLEFIAIDGTIVDTVEIKKT